jgi:hypothetical protein
MSDQKWNAADKGTVPDSGSAPNDQVTTNNAGGAPQGAPSGGGSQPAGQPNNVTEQTHRSGQDKQKSSKS